MPKKVHLAAAMLLGLAVSGCDDSRIHPIDPKRVEISNVRCGGLGDWRSILPHASLKNKTPEMIQISAHAEWYDIDGRIVGAGDLGLS